MIEFFKTPYFLDGIPPLAGAAEVLRKHSRTLTFYLVTSRQDSLQAHTKRWIDAHYPGIFAGLRFGNHFSTEGAVRSKPDLCRMIGAEMIIDDNTKYATECASAGIRTLLFGDYAWNRTDGPLPANVLRVPTWAEVDAELQSIVDARSGDGSGGSGSGGRSPATITGTPAGGTAGAEGAAGAAQGGDRHRRHRRQQEGQGREKEDKEKATQEMPVRADTVGGHQRRTCSSPKSVGAGQTAASALVAAAAAAADAAAVNTTASSPLPGDNQVAAVAAGDKKDAGVPPTAAAAASTQQRASTSAVGSTGEDFVPCAA
ncbi:conserved unknown protein [Ectocarpus siliculosus]|uniref:Uncharacterized protein n=1 Tax=Ectocarpus siliculosus TaxID=2880 RepID=D7FZT5_ECTSI|nr:conserved unknown protein [Ectocarpus siliculosus]|eukprot:CBJ32884.1 conserved unknown protein [Ectocarpus siliculosus]